MGRNKHFESLISTHSAVKLNEFHSPTLLVSDGATEIELSDKYQHAVGGVHGSVYFKMLDDAAWNAPNSLENEYFLVTVSFTTYITRPVKSGQMKAVGKVVNKNKPQFIAESVVYDSEGREIGCGNGLFVRSKAPLAESQRYA